MENVYDIRREKNLTYILPETRDAEPGIPQGVYRNTAILVYLYYPDTLSSYYGYIDNIPQGIDMYIISSRADVVSTVREHFGDRSKENVYYILKENRGRDISALLVTGNGIVRKYEYVCFLHDKKEHCAERKGDTLLWIKNLWGNQVGSHAEGPGYINGILQLFEKHADLGILAPPEPIGAHFNTWYGRGWYGSFGITREIARRLRLRADIREDKPPITFGTVLWFRRAALWKLFEAGWEFSDFDDSGLADGGYLSYGIERIFAYVAQDAGYDTGTVMTAAYAGKQISYLQYEAGLFFREADAFFPVGCLDDLECYKRNHGKVVEFAKKNKKIYLYGAGKMGRLCAALLRAENVLPVGYLISGNDGEGVVDCLPVIAADRLDGLWQDMAVVITAYDQGVQEEMETVLEGKGCRSYIKMWER